jgi:hypothetical protein
LASALFFTPQITSADDNFIAEAIADIEDLIKYGMEGNTDLALSHASTTLAAIIATKSATDRASLHILVTTREAPDRANEIASSKALRGPRAPVCYAQGVFTPLGQ